MASESSPLQEAKKDQNFILRNIKIFSRTLGLITLAVLWISCVFIIRDHSHSYVGFYLIPISVIVTFFEITWILDKAACCVREGCCCHVWTGILFVDTWVKFLMYTGLSIPLFLSDDRILLGIISGLILIILGALYLIKTFRGQVTVTVYKTVTHHRRNSSLVFHEMTTQTDDDLLAIVSEPVPSTSGASNQADQAAAPAEQQPSTSGANGNHDETEDGGATSTPKSSKEKAKKK
ncbi:hypothetical protein EGW08_002705 [Elysia chlorotica]|uniref:MARVEL domain-containing protein n=1 Tax=Elysia chlorotica TaxID=188477 RepID=A0A3S1CD69_ELYCH|nr:hypothetical protein EGW08_002705 [Elysia chlorotica]